MKNIISCRINVQLVRFNLATNQDFIRLDSDILILPINKQNQCFILSVSGTQCAHSEMGILTAPATVDLSLMSQKIPISLLRDARNGTFSCRYAVTSTPSG